MPNTATRFPDTGKRLVNYYLGRLGAGHAGLETPANLAAVLPFVRVMRGGGGSDTVSNRPTIDIDVFDVLYDDVEGLAEQIRQELVGPPPILPWIDKATCLPGPQELPWGDGSIRRFGATYHMVTRRTSGP